MRNHPSVTSYFGLELEGVNFLDYVKVLRGQPFQEYF